MEEAAFLAEECLVDFETVFLEDFREPLCWARFTDFLLDFRAVARLEEAPLFEDLAETLCEACFRLFCRRDFFFETAWFPCFLLECRRKELFPAFFDLCFRDLPL